MSKQQEQPQFYPPNQQPPAYPYPPPSQQQQPVYPPYPNGAAPYGGYPAATMYPPQQLPPPQHQPYTAGMPQYPTANTQALPYPPAPGAPIYYQQVQPQIIVVKQAETSNHLLYFVLGFLCCPFWIVGACSRVETPQDLRWRRASRITLFMITIFLIIYIILIVTLIRR